MSCRHFLPGALPICLSVWAFKYSIFPCLFLHCAPSADVRLSFSYLKSLAPEVSFIACEVYVGSGAFSVPFRNPEEFWALSCLLPDFLLPLPNSSFHSFSSWLFFGSHIGHWVGLFIAYDASIAFPPFDFHISAAIQGLPFADFVFQCC